MKKLTALFLTAALSMAGAQNVTSTQIADTSLANTNITIETGKYQGPLSSLLGAVAKSAGYELVLEVNVDNLATEGGAVPVAYSFKGKPFNEVWPLLMDIYDLNYTVTNLGDQPVIRVNKEAVQEVVALETVDPEYAVQRAKVFFGSPVQQGAGAENKAADSETQSTAQQYKFDSPTLRVAADTVANRLIIRGSNQEVNEVANFVRNLDEAATAQREEYGIDSSTSARRTYAANSDAKQLMTFLQTQYPNLSITATPMGRSLLIKGDGEIINEAFALLTEIDPPSGSITQKVFKLNHANALELKAVLTDTLARQITNAAVNSASSVGSRKTDATGADTEVNVNSQNTALDDASRLAAQEPTIIADPRTNTLIIRGTPAQVQQLQVLIPTLDTNVPQINLQVRIQEINESARNSLGVNWKANAGGFQVGIAGSGINATFNPLQSVVGFNLFPALNALESQTMAKRIYDGSVTLQSGQRNLENAGIGSQDASSSAAATIRSGGRLEINIPGPTNGDNIEKTIPYGVILDFFDPIVAPDGTITVRVRGQINTIANQEALNAAVAQGVPPYLLQFLNSEAQTKISFQPGETVLLAGLSKTDESSTKEGLPFLSQIPGIGALAGSQASNKDNTEMLFVITADIIE